MEQQFSISIPVTHAPGALPKDEIHLWQIHAGELAADNSLSLASLSVDERHRAKAYKNPRQGQLWAISRTSLRAILAGYLRQQPQQLIFTSGRYGKPGLASPNRQGICFNLSHSGDQVLLAVARTRVGADIERHKPLPELYAILGRFFCANERRQVTTASPLSQADSFFQLWTRKEAVIKALGLGLGAPLQQIDVACGDATAWQSPVLPSGLARSQALVTRSVPCPSGYSAAIAIYHGAASGPNQLKLKSFQFTGRIESHTGF